MQPARAEAGGSTKYEVTVRYSDSGLRFEDPPEIRLAEGDILILTFRDVPEGMVPGVAFHRSGDEFGSPLGPFQEALQTADRIILRGNSGMTGLFSCTALLSSKLRGEEPPLRSTNDLGIDSELSARPAKEIRVSVRPKPLPSEVPVEVTVDLERVTIFTPDAVVWNYVFEDLEPRDYEPLLYLDAEGTPVESGPFGPFGSLAVGGIFEPLGDGRILAYRLVTSENHGGLGEYHFNVGVRPTREGTFREILSVVDPIIDNVGPPHP